jgi:pyrimidine deaminase RibD-like protein
MNIVESDRELMERAIRVARQCVSERGKVSPKVGAVVARGNSLVAEGRRGEYEPGDHAEYTLLERKLGDEALAGATLFTTLEPCTERNPPKIPCVERIVERRIRRVFIGVLDPNPKIRGLGQQRLREAGIEVVLFDPDLMAQIEEMNREFERDQRAKLRRNPEQTADPALDEVGPNGHRVAYNDDGDKVELIPDPENPGEFWPMVLRRNDPEILREYNRLWDIVWWNRHQDFRESDRPHEIDWKLVSLQEFEDAIRAVDKNSASRDIGDILLDNYDYGLVSGRMSALSWVLGAEWNESLDT